MTVNPFEKHGIKHLSASSINTYMRDPAAWVARYLLGHKFKYGVAAQVGLLTEKVVQDCLLGMSFEDALGLAHISFNKDNALNVNEKDLARINDIAPMAQLALEALLGYGEPEFVESINGVDQQRIEINCQLEGYSMPFIGYLDFVFPKVNKIVDLKTTLRMPSEMSLSHLIQAAIYQKARPDYDLEFLYVTPKKSKIFEIDNLEHLLNDIKNNTKRLGYFLEVCGNAQTAAKLVPVNPDSWDWKGNESTRKELFGV